MIAVRPRRRLRAAAFRLAPAVVIAAAVGMVVGVWSGATAVSIPVIQAPHECTVALDAAARAFDAYEGQVVAVHNRATRGMSEFAGHDATVARLWTEIDKAKAASATARSTCLGHS